MVKLFTQDVSYTNTSTITRDTRTLEDQVNAFVRQPTVVPRSSEVVTYAVGGNQYMTIKLEYDIKQGG